jgi:TusA-related sulfurtransferase
MRDNVLDVSGLEPPEPRDRIVAALEQLGPGDYLRVLHHREPLMFYPWLQEHGYAWHTRAGATTAFEIFIWRVVDQTAAAAVQKP